MDLPERDERAVGVVAEHAVDLDPGAKDGKARLQLRYRGAARAAPQVGIIRRRRQRVFVLVRNLGNTSQPPILLEMLHQTRLL